MKSELIERLDRLYNALNKTHGSVDLPETLSLISDCRSHIEAMQWVSVEEKMPEPSQSVIAARRWEDGSMSVIYCVYQDFGFPVAIWGSEKNPITHWMPISELSE